MEFGKLSVVVVEDHDFQRRMVMRLLTDLGVGTLAEAVNGRDALTRLQEGALKPDIVVTDLDMPEMDGIELIRHVSEHHLAQAVIIASGLDASLLHSVEQMARAYGLQVLGNVEKPLTRERLAALLRLYLRLDKGDGTAPPKVYADDVAVSGEDVRRAFEQGELKVVYQPQLDFANGRVSGCEALVRWHRVGAEKPLLPKLMIEAIEREGWTSQLTDLVLGVAARQRAEWAGLGLELGMSVNVSVLNLTDLETADRYAEIVRVAGAEPKQITLEVTESRVMAEARQALNILNRLRLKGFGLAIDDFGTGFSSMQQLSNVPFTELKIDGGFVQNCDRDARRRSIVESSLDLARRLKLKTVAEGLESRSEWNVLKGSGCDRAQGWLIAKAMPPDEFLQWAESYIPPGD
ncbi:MAG: EAL domain-containing response regulator [Pseudomonadota bacterium]